MKKRLDVQIDHFGIFTKIPDNERILYDLGFTGAGGLKETLPDEKGKLPGCLHFVMDNGYMEYMRTYPEDFEPCKNTRAGLVYFEFAMKDAVRARDELKRQGILCTDVVRAVRYADHGEKKGDAVFECIALDKNIFPNTMTGGVCHKTKELFYHNGRYQHDNGAYRIESVWLCMETAASFEETARGTESFQKELGEFDPGECIRGLYLMDREEMERETGCTLPETLDNTAAVVIKTDNPDKIKEAACQKGYACQSESGQCIVNLLDEMNIIFVFES